MRKSAVSLQHPALIDGLLGVVFLLVYFATCLPSVLAADNGEFQLVAWKLGIAHPPGYALYTLVGWLFARFFASPAYALNVLSAILAALTLVVVSRTVRRLTRSRVAGVLAAALLGTSTTFWAQATTANIRMPTALFTALCVSLLVEWSHSRRDQASEIRDQTRPSRQLVIFSFVFSLGLGHHLSLAFPGVFFVAYIFLNDRALIKQPRRWIAPLLAFALGLVVLLYFPLRGATGGTLADGEPTTYLAQPDKFLDHVLGRGFEGDFFYFVSTRSDLLADRAALLPTLFTFQFNPFVIVLVLVGALRLIRRDWKLAVMLLGGMVLHTFVALTYRAPQTVEYLLPAYVLLAIVIGDGLGSFGGPYAARFFTPNVLRFTYYAGCAACCVLIVLQFASNFPSFQWLQHHDDTRAYAESLLNDAPPNAVILSNWHWANPLWYLQQVEGVRPDVEVQYVYPRGEPLAQSWLKAIDAGVKANRPVIVDMFFRDEFNASPYFFKPVSTEAWQVCRGACPVAEAYRALDFNLGAVLIFGPRPLTPITAAGDPMTVYLEYQLLQPLDPSTTFFVHLVDLAGNVLGQADVSAVAGQAGLQTTDMFVQRFRVTPLVEVKPGKYQLVTGAYTIDPTGTIKLLPTLKPNFQPSDQVRLPITAAEVTPAQRLIDPTGVNLGGGLTFLGSSASLNGELHPGDRLTLDLNFIAARPILRDYVVSVQMTGNGWRVGDDSVPALGAIPTLKWIAGSQITDRHVLTIPDDAAPGPASISVILYDAFTQEPLALLDAELIKQGPSIPLGTWNIVSK